MDIGEFYYNHLTLKSSDGFLKAFGRIMAKFGFYIVLMSIIGVFLFTVIIVAIFPIVASNGGNYHMLLLYVPYMVATAIIIAILHVLSQGWSNRG